MAETAEKSPFQKNTIRCSDYQCLYLTRRSSARQRRFSLVSIQGDRGDEPSRLKLRSLELKRERSEQQARQQAQNEIMKGLKNEENARQVVQKDLAVIKEEI